MLTHSSDRSFVPLEGSQPDGLPNGLLNGLPNGLPNGLLVSSLVGSLDGLSGALTVGLLVPSTRRIARSFRSSAACPPSFSLLLFASGLPAGSSDDCLLEHWSARSSAACATAGPTHHLLARLTDRSSARSFLPRIGCLPDASPDGFLVGSLPDGSTNRLLVSLLIGSLDA